MDMHVNLEHWNTRAHLQCINDITISSVHYTVAYIGIELFFHHWPEHDVAILLGDVL
jgi:hypothetical protein